MGEADLQQLISACLDEDRRSQKKLYKEFYGFAMGICLRYANNRYEAAEIMNQGFFKVFINLHKYDASRPFKAWLGRIMINMSIDYYRGNLKMAYTDDLEVADNVSGDLATDHRVSYKELLDMIQQLPQAYRTVFNLYAIEGYTHDEIGEILNINTGTSKSNLFKAREKLKKMLLKAAELPRYGSGLNDVQIIAINVNSAPVNFFNNDIRL